MNRIFQRLLLTCCTAALASCERRELPVPAHDPGNVTTAAVNMESDYRYQIYYNLRNNTEVGRNLKTSWDIGFEASADGWHVILNGSKSMFALPISKSDFSMVTLADTVGYGEHKVWDAPSGNIDSTAIGDWRSPAGKIYIIDRGYNSLGQSLGFEKIQIQPADAQTYTVAYSSVNTTAPTIVTITKDSTYNFMFLSFDEKTTTIVEPPKNTWDIAFTQYTHTFYDPSYQPYLVTGCLLNRWNTTAIAVDSTTTFDAVTYDYVVGKEFSRNINTVGYDWKTFTGSAYITDATKVYVIKDANGYYYKLHFIDFLNSTGVKGNPKWEYQQL